MLDQFRKCMTLVDRTTLRQAAAVAGLVFVTAFLEAFGIGLIFAFVNVLVEPSQIQNLAWLGTIVGPALAENTNKLLVFLALCLIGTFAAKNLILLSVYYVQARFSTVNEALLTTRLLESYLKGSYALHLTRNSAEFIRNITGAVGTVFAGVIMNYIKLVSEFTVISALALVLFLVEPMLTLGAGLVLGATVGVFFAFSKRHFTIWGQQEQEILGKILQMLQQGFHSIKEVKVLGRQNFILAGFRAPRHELARIRTKLSVMSHAPKLWVETVIVTAVLLVVLYALTKGGGSVAILSALTLFAAAAFRMIPSMNRVLIALNAIKTGSHAVNLVYHDLNAFSGNPDEATRSVDEAGTEALSFSEALSVEGLSFRYPGGDGAVLKDIDLVLRKGESLGLVGPSGSGKSTLVDIILGLLVPTSGRIAVDGVDISGSLRAWRRQIGYVPQSIYIIDDTLKRNVAFGLFDDEIDEALVENAVRLAQLEDLVRELPDGLETRMGERGARLSGGQRQRVGIARALYRDPQVLILDEATSSLDAETEHEINNAIERLRGEKTLIIIAHRLSTVRKCQRLAFIRDGRLLDTGSFNELNARNGDFSRMVELSRL